MEGRSASPRQKLHTRAVLPPAIPGSESGAGFAYSSSGTPAKISSGIFRDRETSAVVLVMPSARAHKKEQDHVDHRSAAAH